jgi:hypothetical protein
VPLLLLPALFRLIAAFERAAKTWKGRLDDPVVVVLNVGFDDLDPGVLGSTTMSRRRARAKVCGARAGFDPAA